MSTWWDRATDKQRMERLNSVLRYDSESGHLYWKEDRGRHKVKGKIAGYAHCEGYVAVGLDGKRFLAHRVAWMLTYGTWPDEWIDHVNGNRSDNRLVNLRECSPSENNSNRKNGPGRDLPKGVSFHRRTGKYQAHVRKSGRVVYSGLFASVEEAAVAYVANASIAHGEFARFA